MTDAITLRFGDYADGTLCLPQPELAFRAAAWALERDRPGLAAALAQLAVALSDTDLVQRVAELERAAERDQEMRMGDDL